jgi:predicted nucleic acid-binding protein
LSVLIDTNVLLRRLEPRHPHFRDAVAGTERLIDSGEAVHVTAQNIAEFWAAATRATTQNGLGLDVAAAAAAVDRIELAFALLLDDPRIYQVIGNQVYDARLVAAMLVYRIGRILTFNGADFSRYGLVVLHPSAVV